MAHLERTALIHALQWHIDAGADEAMADAPVDATAMPDLSAILSGGPETAQSPAATATSTSAPRPATDGAVAAIRKAQELAAAAQTLDELRGAIENFDGLDIRNTATNMVFADGLAGAAVMIIGEAPGADEDRMGRPFVGVSGQLLDKILAAIGLDRQSTDPMRAVYISNMLNWRPPGNRTPTDAEIDIARPFIERHIALAQPRIVIFAGGVPAKGLLRSTETISRLRGRWHDMGGVQARATYHPSYLLRTPSQKKAVWADMLAVQELRKTMDLLPDGARADVN